MLMLQTFLISKWSCLHAAYVHISRSSARGSNDCLLC